MVVELRHPNGKSTRGPGNPIKLSRTGGESYSPAPAIGQDTDAVLSRLLGYEPGRVAQLKAKGAVG
jgi:crotonobetainyl-CoA:carnitine CoA-transferase CaiB-like acyl-CoA transferase